MDQDEGAKYRYVFSLGSFHCKHAKPWRTSSCPSNVIVHLDSAGGEREDVSEQLQLSGAVCPSPIPKAIAHVAGQLKGTQISFWTAQYSKKDWINFWLIERGVDKGSLRVFICLFNCCCYWNGILWGWDCASRCGRWSFLLSPFGSPATAAVTLYPHSLHFGTLCSVPVLRLGILIYFCLTSPSCPGEPLPTAFPSYPSRVWSTAEWLSQICWWLLWKLAVSWLYKLAPGHREMLLYSPLLFFSAFLWSASSPLALTFVDVTILKRRDLGIY